MELLRLTPFDGWTLEEACLGNFITNVVEAILIGAGRRALEAAYFRWLAEMTPSEGFRVAARLWKAGHALRGEN